MHTHTLNVNIRSGTYYKSNIAVTNGLHRTINETALTSLEPTFPSRHAHRQETRTFVCKIANSCIQSKRDTLTVVHMGMIVCFYAHKKSAVYHFHLKQHSFSQLEI